MHIFYLVNSSKKSLQLDNNYNNNNNINSSSSSSNNNDYNNSSLIKDERKKLNNLQDNNNSNNNKNKKIGQFPHQVGGHSAMLSIEGNICKPLINRELEFYEFSKQSNSIHSFFISPFLANFYGVVEVLKSKNDDDDDSESAQQQQQHLQQLQLQQKQKQQQQQQMYMNNQQQINYNNIINIKNNKKPKDCKHPTGTQQKYIVLEDLTLAYKKPCIVDIKVGTRQRGAICSSTTSTSHGIRICGMKIHSPLLGNIVFDRYFGRALNAETLEDSLFNFFTGSNHLSSNNNNNNISSYDNNFHTTQRISLIESIIEKLSQIEFVFSNKNQRFPYRIYSSSLLIIYEGCIDTIQQLHQQQQQQQEQQTHHQMVPDISNIINDGSCTDIEMNSSSSSSSGNNSPFDDNNSSCTTTPSQSPITTLINSTDSYSSSTTTNEKNNSNQITINNSNNKNRNSGISNSSSSSMIEDFESSSSFSSEEEEIDESFISSSDMDFDIFDERLNSNSNVNSNRSSRSNSSSSGNSSGNNNNKEKKLQSNSRGCIIKNDVKMIDFAHAIPLGEKDAVEDDGYLFGISNLLMILFKIKSKLSTNDESIKKQKQQQQQHHNNSTINIDQTLLSSSTSSSTSFENQNEEFTFSKIFKYQQNHIISN